jgi:hypothetical protein
MLVSNDVNRGSRGGSGIKKAAYVILCGSMAAGTTESVFYVR